MVGVRLPSEPGGNTKLLGTTPRVTAELVKPIAMEGVQCHLRLEAPQEGLLFWTCHDERKQRRKDLVRLWLVTRPRPQSSSRCDHPTHTH